MNASKYTRKEFWCPQTDVKLKKKEKYKKYTSTEECEEHQFSMTLTTNQQSS